MPSFVFQCSKCQHVFEELCGVEDRKKVKCVKCRSKKIQQVFTPPTIIGTSSKMDNFDYAAQKNFDRAQGESRTAREEAAARELDPYRHIDDISSGTNFDPTKW
jgi:putative FmdB family regulatory protein